MEISKYPLLKITFFFILGIVIASQNVLPSQPLFFITLVVFFIALVCYTLSRYHKKGTLLFGFTSLLLALLIGITTFTIHDETQNSNHFIHQLSENQTKSLYTVILKEKRKSSAKYQKYIAEIVTLDQKESRGKILVSFLKESTPPLIIGQRIHISSPIFLHKAPTNPNQFDYGNYLKKQAVYGQSFPHPDNIIITNQIQKDGYYYADFIRNKIVGNLERKGFHQNELQVVFALLLGQQQDIAPDIVTHYQVAGAVHILSVSGLHVGFIMLFIGFLLRPLPNTVWGKTLKIIIITASLWLFALLAGLSPSVVRSVTMYSFLAFALYYNRSSTMYQSLTASLLLILLCNPAFLFDIGFQLSYTAVFFIVWFQPVLSKFWKTKNKISQYFWDIITVSLAAQLGTFPLSLYYFHQFPALFLITNIVVIPLLAVIMIYGIIVLLLAICNLLPLFASKSLEYLVYTLNQIIKRVASFEQFSIQNIPFSITMLISSYLLIISCILWYKKPIAKNGLFVVISLVVIQLAFLDSKRIQFKDEWIVFDINKQSVFVHKQNHHASFFHTDELIKEPENHFILQSFLVGNFIKSTSTTAMQNLYFVNNTKILVIDSIGVYPKNCKPDIIILIQSPKINLNRIIKELQPNEIIADASNYKSYIQWWSVTCKQNKIPFHYTREKGFYKLKK